MVAALVRETNTRMWCVTVERNSQFRCGQGYRQVATDRYGAVGPPGEIKVVLEES